MKNKAIDKYKLTVILAKTFIDGQLELYKIEFANTSNNKYLEVMNKLNDTFKLICNMDFEIKRLSKECIRLTKENKELKK
jgi:hypothetical protein